MDFRSAHDRSDRLSLDDALERVLVEEIEDDDRDAVVHAERERRRIHDLEALLERRLVLERGVLLRLRVGLRIGRVDAVDLRRLEERVRADLARPERRCGVRREIRIARAAREDDDAPLLEVADRLALDEGLGELRHLDRRHDARGNADRLEGVHHRKPVDDRREHAHRVARHAVDALPRARQAPEDVPAAQNDADFAAHRMDLLHPLGHERKVLRVDALARFLVAEHLP